MKKRLITENWYRFMNEVEEESNMDSLLKDMEEEQLMEDFEMIQKIKKTRNG